jgi:hypothetical protein
VRFVVRTLVAALLLFVILQFTGYVHWSPGGETVVLRTFDGRGIGSDTTLWIVDLGGHPYVRSGRTGSDWLARLRATPEVQLVRDGQVTAYRAVVVPKMQDQVNRAMAEKYGLAASAMAFWVEPAESTPIRLERSRD